jgi:hypothetical protein
MINQEIQNKYFQMFRFHIIYNNWEALKVKIDIVNWEIYSYTFPVIDFKLIKKTSDRMNIDDIYSSYNIPQAWIDKIIPLIERVINKKIITLNDLLWNKSLKRIIG